MSKTVLWKTKEKLTVCHISMLGGRKTNNFAYGTKWSCTGLVYCTKMNTCKNIVEYCVVLQLQVILHQQYFISAMEQ